MSVLAIMVSSLCSQSLCKEEHARLLGLKDWHTILDVKIRVLFLRGVESEEYARRHPLHETQHTAPLSEREPRILHYAARTEFFLHRQNFAKHIAPRLEGCSSKEPDCLSPQRKL